MNLIDSQLNGIKVIKPTVHGDERGFFKEVIHPQRMDDIGISHRFVQVNHSRSQQWTLRGLHFQYSPYGQAKLVRCLRGRIYDVAVDIRPNSDTFGQYFGVELSDEDHLMMYVPIGFAHGFLALTLITEVEYACGDMYAPKFEGSISWDDKTINIKWPIPKGVAPLISDKDRKASSLNSLISQLNWPNGV